MRKESALKRLRQESPIKKLPPLRAGKSRALPGRQRTPAQAAAILIAVERKIVAGFGPKTKINGMVIDGLLVGQLINPAINNLQRTKDGPYMKAVKACRIRVAELGPYLSSEKAQEWSQMNQAEQNRTLETMARAIETGEREMVATAMFDRSYFAYRLCRQLSTDMYQDLSKFSLAALYGKARVIADRHPNQRAEYEESLENQWAAGSARTSTYGLLMHAIELRENAVGTFLEAFEGQYSEFASMGPLPEGATDMLIRGDSALFHFAQEATLGLEPVKSLG